MSQSENPGRLRNEISAAIVRLHSDHYGRGAVRARTYITHDVIVCVLGDVLTAAERTLLDDGQEDAVREVRSRFRKAMRARFVRAVEAIVGGPVRSAFSDVDCASNEAIEVFVLERPV